MKNKTIIAIVILMFLFITACNKTNNTANINKIDQLAKISATISVNPQDGYNLLQKSGYTIESYKKAITDIMLNDENFKKFTEKKEQLLKEMKK